MLTTNPFWLLNIQQSPTWKDKAVTEEVTVDSQCSANDISLSQSLMNIPGYFKNQNL